MTTGRSEGHRDGSLSETTGGDDKIDDRPGETRGQMAGEEKDAGCPVETKDVGRSV